MQFLIISIVLIGMVFGPQSALSAPTMCDGIPLISQAKSLVQIFSGDIEGARKTQENFSRQIPIVRSIVESSIGNSDEVKKVQEQFLGGFLEPLVDNTPVIGHVKGAIHMVVGDTERGQEIMKGATNTGLVMVGSALGGPGAVISPSLLTNRLCSTVNSSHLVLRNIHRTLTRNHLANMLNNGRIWPRH